MWPFSWLKKRREAQEAAVQSLLVDISRQRRREDDARTRQILAQTLNDRKRLRARGE